MATRVEEDSKASRVGKSAEKPVMSIPIPFEAVSPMLTTEISKFLLGIQI
jgi:hypothetical protein